MRDEGEVISAYEAEFAGAAEPPRRSNRGFWLVIGALGIASVLLVVAILANEPLKDSIAHAESTLRDAETAAGQIHADAGSYGAADATAMTAADPTNTYRTGDSASTGLDDVSIATGSGEWAAAVQARPGACFYLRHTDTGETFYGVGTDCTGRTALGATDPRW
jgi:Tfp pilus assembly protein PilX